VLLESDNSLDTEVFKVGSGRSTVVVAGPGSTSTVPGLIVSEITYAVAKSAPVIRIDVDLNTELMTGLHRAPSLSAAHGPIEGQKISRHEASTNSRLREQSFRKLIGPDVATAIAYAWPGIDNSWIKQYVRAGRLAGARTVVACASLPQPGHARAVGLASSFAHADALLVGDEMQARELASVFGRSGPIIETHPALSLGGRIGSLSKKVITTFLPKDDVASLTTLLAAFDAIPEAWIEDYELRIVMRFADPKVSQLVSSSYHAKQVELIGDAISGNDLLALCSASSALGIAEPMSDSPVFSLAVLSGVSTVVLGSSLRPEVGRGYVGGLLAERNRTASLHVALIHALRLAGLRFPNPNKWDQFAERIVGDRRQRNSEVQAVIRVS